MQNFDFMDTYTKGGAILGFFLYLAKKEKKRKCCQQVFPWAVLGWAVQNLCLLYYYFASPHPTCNFTIYCSWQMIMLSLCALVTNYHQQTTFCGGTSQRVNGRVQYGLWCGYGVGNSHSLSQALFMALTADSINIWLTSYKTAHNS